MRTFKIELEDSIYQNIVQSGVDIQAKIKEFLENFVEVATLLFLKKKQKKEFSIAVTKYRTNPEAFTPINDDFWNEMENTISTAKSL